MGRGVRQAGRRPDARCRCSSPTSRSSTSRQRDFVSLDALRAKDSGRIVGPKAAKLGELKSRFPDRVAPGVGIPFGLYRATVLDRPYRNSGKTVYEWMVESFRKLEAMPAGSREAAEFAEKLRAEIYSIVLNTDPGPQFREQLRAAMAKEFGADFRGGVFVRSDTNVEDLPGFTGAGLNLTLFNVVGFDNIVKAISEVWASPYTPRAWAWRQSHMKGPEHVYPAVLLLQDGALGHLRRDDHAGCRHGRSGRALRRGQRRRRRRGGRAGGRVGPDRPATAATRASWPRRRRRAAWSRRPRAGSRSCRCSGRDTLLAPGEIKQLIAFADEIPKQFPQLGEDGKPVAADVEFAFVDGKLWLLQIRPFNESRAARGASSPDPDGQGAGSQSRQDASTCARRFDETVAAMRKASGRVALAAAALCLGPGALPIRSTATRRPASAGSRALRLANEGVVKDVKQPPGCDARPRRTSICGSSARPSTCRRPIPSSRGR